MTMNKGKLLVFGALVLGSCTESDIDPMMRQEKYKAYFSSDFYPDQRAMRTPPGHTIPREHPLDARTAPPVTAALMQRGRDRFDIYCAVCHGYAGDGDSIVASKMSLRAPPSLVEAKVSGYSIGQLFDIMSNGYGYMPRYDAELSATDRWAIANYIKALQYSQHASIDDVPADKRGELDKPAQAESPEHSEKKE